MQNTAFFQLCGAGCRRILVGLVLVLLFQPLASAASCTMIAWSGSDGPFNLVNEGGYTGVCQAQGSPGSYSGFMYFQRPGGVTFTPGNPLYVEVDYLDETGTGNIGIQYDALSTLGSAFQTAQFALNAAVLNTGALKTAVFRLDNAAFSYDENGGNDLRLTQNGGSLQFNVVQVRVSDQPTALYLSDTAFLGPYSGPAYAGGTPVDATTMLNKLVCGYQGWYGAPGDADNNGWSHWSSNNAVFSNATLQIDPWPDMSEATAAEQFAVPGYSYPSGPQASLFSSDDARTILRHFQWMEAWGIDGVAVQRFVVAVPSVTLDRVLTGCRQAANQTGRTYFVEYDMSGMVEADITPTMSTDWQYLVSTLQITADSRYLHQGGLPVVGIFGFYPGRFSSTTAQAIVNLFSSSGATPAFVAGAGDWTWRSTWTPQWLSVLYTMGSWQPWNTGDTTEAMGTTSPPNYANTSYWAADKALLAANNVLYVPQIYPGCNSDNRDGLTPGTGLQRLGGAVLWKQFTDAYSIGAQSAFLGMFDEFSEGTQIAKTTDSPPTQPPYTLNNGGLPSDCWLCFTSLGSKLLKGQYTYTTATPNCAGLTQPTIPDPVAPLLGATVPGPSVTLSWNAALALSGGGSLSAYQVYLDGAVLSPGSLALSDALSLSPGVHVWRVRAVNSLGNAGGWSVAQTFTVSGPTWTATPTCSPTRSPTATASASPSATSTASPSASVTGSPSTTPSCSVSPSRSPSATATLAQTQSASPSPSPSASASSSATATPAQSQSASPSASSSATATPAQTQSASPSASSSATATPAQSPSSSPSASPTPYGGTPSATQTVAATPTPIGVPCAYSATMTLDGQFLEPSWSLSPWQSIGAGECNYYTACGSVDTTAWAQYRFLNTSAALWIAVDVHDPGLLYADLAAPWNGTGVEVFLDLNHSLGSYNAGANQFTDPDTYQWCVTYNAASIVQYRSSVARGILAAGQAIPGTGYTLEIEIPWANLGVPGQPAGGLSGVEIAVDVSNAAGNARDHAIAAFSAGVNPYDTDPGLWGTLAYAACAPTPTSTLTPSATASPSLTPSPTLSATPSTSATASPSATSVPSGSPSPSSTPSVSPSPSASPLPTATPSPTETPSPTPTPQPSATPPPTALPSASRTSLPSASPSPQPTATRLVTATASPTPGLAQILRAVAWPNPNPTAVQVQLTGWTPYLSLRVYTQAMRRVADVHGAAAGPGWGQVALPADFLAGAANGTYFFEVLLQDSVQGAKAGKFVVLR